MQRAVLIQRISQSDKEFHFQNWMSARLDDADLQHDFIGRNSYPDFTLVHRPEGYEVKGLQWPGREASYDSNSRVPTGKHNGRTIYYAFGRYPASTDDPCTRSLTWSFVMATSSMRTTPISTGTPASRALGRMAIYLSVTARCT
jgi:hypothetical protein